MLRRMFCKLGATGLASMAISKQISALEKVAGAPAKKWAVVYSTECGSSKDAASWIAEGIGNEIATAIDVKNSPKLEDYEFVVLGGVIQGSKFLKPLTDYVTANKTSLTTKIAGFFAVCGNMGGSVVGADRHKQYFDDQLFKTAGVTDKPAKVFPGRAKNDCAASKSIVQMIGKEFDNLKKEDCTAFGKKLLEDNKVGVRHSSMHKTDVRLSYISNRSGRVPYIDYSLPSSNHVQLTICSTSGQKLATIVSQYQNAGAYRVPLDGLNLTPGCYIYRFQAGAIIETGTANIIR